MRSRQWMLTGIALLLSPLYLYSQTQGGGSGYATSAPGTISSLTATIGSPFLKGITGAPFSADVIEQSDQTLADGNHIRREMHGRVFRDSEGRTREETELPAPPTTGDKRVRVMIQDPVQGLFMTLLPQNKVATIQHIGKQHAPPPVVADKPAAPSRQSDLRTIIPRQQEDLGTMEIEGFLVTGTRVTHTLEAGRIGNDKPIVSTNEIWFSADVKEALLTKSESPQSGQHIRKLVNIHLGNPDPLLFQLPPDYTVKDISR